MSLSFIERTGARRLRSTLPSVAPQETARLAYRAMVDEQLATVLGDWGLERDGDAFWSPSDAWHLGVALAPVTWNSTAHHQFDVGVIAVPREAWDRWRETESALPETPDPAVYYAQDVAAVGGLKGRLSAMAGRRADRRWTVRAREDTAPVAASVLADVRRRVLPAFAARATPENPAA